MTAVDIAARVADGSLSAVDVARRSLELAGSVGKDLNAFITICEEKALAQAEAVDKAVQRSGDVRKKPLLGVPIAIKDNISYRDYPCTCGSRLLESYIPPYDATVVARLIDAGAVIIGKTNMDEFAMGSSNETSYFGPVKNPVDAGLTPGGSSGGSAAAVARSIVPIALGSETGGSVRQPASFCGIIGLKPSYGAVSRYGLVAFVSSADQIGPFARHAEDLELVYRVIAGRDPLDSTSVAVERSGPAGRGGKYRIGVPEEYFLSELDPEVNGAVLKTVSRLEAEGHEAVKISLPLTEKATPVYYIISGAEASSNLARFDGVRFGLRRGGDAGLDEMYAATRAAGFGTEVKRRIIMGTHVLSAGYYDEYYIKAAKVRELIRREFETAFESVDLIIAPTAPTPPFRLGEKLDDPMLMYLSDIYTTPANLAGIPAVSVPAGVSSDGRPIGVQFIAPYLAENRLFGVASILEGLC